MSKEFEREPTNSLISWDDFPLKDQESQEKDNNDFSEKDRKTVQSADRPLKLLQIFSSNDAWRSDAKCIGSDGDIFFVPEAVMFDPKAKKESDESRARRESLAKAVCGACKVRVDCLEEALSMGSGTSGIWGGLTEEERQRVTESPARKSA